MSWNWILRENPWKFPWWMILRMAMNSVLDNVEDVQLICWMGREMEWSWMVFMVDGCYNDIIFYMMILKSFDEMIWII